jgi:hypothetical protein
LLVLLVMGRRSTKSRAEIVKAVLAARGRADNDAARLLRTTFTRQIEVVCELTVDLIEAPRHELDKMLQRASKSYVEDASILADEEVSAVLRSLPLMSWVDGITDGKRLARTFSLAAAASELEAEKFYVPRTALDLWHEPWAPDRTWKMLDPMMRAVASRSATQKKDATPGRNELCPCKSGKKFKRCCGA